MIELLIATALTTLPIPTDFNHRGSGRDKEQIVVASVPNYGIAPLRQGTVRVKIEKI